MLRLGLVNGAGVAKTAVLDDGVPVQERRARMRVPLHCPLSILAGRPPAHDLATVAGNLSSHGFYCVVERPLAPGDRLDCVLRLPRLPDLPAVQALRCEAQVVWVRLLDDGRFGIGCRIEDYIVVT